MGWVKREGEVLRMGWDRLGVGKGKGLIMGKGGGLRLREGDEIRVG